ncbi:MAG: hypothetical protein KC503_34000 [Myxococcales bacterium]|nr:hypothetical protein [Myxococcales bacterium]
MWIGGQPYLDVAFDLEPLTARPLAHLLEALLDHHHESELVLLRPLSAREREQLGKRLQEALVEAWANLVVGEQDRVRPRTTEA